MRSTLIQKERLQAPKEGRRWGLVATLCQEQTDKQRARARCSSP